MYGVSVVNTDVDSAQIIILQAEEQTQTNMRSEQSFRIQTL